MKINKQPISGSSKEDTYHGGVLIGASYWSVPTIIKPNPLLQAEQIRTALIKLGRRFVRGIK